MAKNSGMLPVPKRGGGVVRVVLGVLLVGALVLVIKHPVDAAEATTGGVNVIGDALDGVATFLRNLH
ncbi:hypothetical protein AB0L41_31830 [Amycolatopsis mediterranei]|uniref:hypothetical protein n=1 Tax=Amycolatopsis mediterranei TaxID=33910 RepID=UPI003443C4FC